MKITNKNMCPVCGYPNLEKPAYTTISEHEYNPFSGSLEICSSCGYQFGYDDGDLEITHVQWREHWIAGGMIWDQGLSSPPEGWDPVKQLENLKRFDV